MAIPVQNEWHPCEADNCMIQVMYDDEPYCFMHSPDEGSSVRGYSYKVKHSTDDISWITHVEQALIIANPES